MGRPNESDAEVLRCAEDMAAALLGLADLAAVLDIRLREVRRRVYGDTPTMRVLTPAIEQLGELASGVHRARSLAREQLEILQRERSVGGWRAGVRVGKGAARNLLARTIQQQLGGLQ